MNKWSCRRRCCIVLLLVAISSSRVRCQRQDASGGINNWIRTIRQAPNAKAPPGWNGRSPLNVITDLPSLQNVDETNEGRSRRFPKSAGFPLQNKPNSRGFPKELRQSSKVSEERPFQRPDEPFKRPKESPFRRAEEEPFKRPEEDPFSKRPDGPAFRRPETGGPHKEISRNRLFTQQQQGSNNNRQNAGPPRRKKGPNQRFPGAAAASAIFLDGADPLLQREESIFKKAFETPTGGGEQQPLPLPNGEVKKQTSPFLPTSLVGGKEQRHPASQGKARPNHPHVVDIPPKRQHQSGQPGGQNGGQPITQQFPNQLDRTGGHNKDLGPTKNNKFPSGDDVQHGFKPFFRASEQFSSNDVDADDDASFKLFSDDEDLSDGPIVELGDRPFPPPKASAGGGGRPPVSIPRPIPIPGPNDFPPPPPPESTIPSPPPPPPTHPTHPPPITHPPEHFQVNAANEERNAFFSDLAFKGDEEKGSSAKDGGNLQNHRSFKEDASSSKGVSKEEEDEGFFHIPESFPSLETLGAGFESMKIRNKRSAEHQFPRPPQHVRPLEQVPSQSSRRRQGDFGFQPGFWEEVETNLFEHEGPSFGQRNQPFVRRGNRNQRPTIQYVQQQQQQQRLEPLQQQQLEPLQQQHLAPNAGRLRDPYPQQSVQSYPEQNDDEYSRNSFAVDEKDNEILGSGNFEVIKGGTFYDGDTHHQTKYNAKPQNNYGGDFFENFRDFADIKGDLNHYNY